MSPQGQARAVQWSCVHPAPPSRRQHPDWKETPTSSHPDPLSGDAFWILWGPRERADFPSPGKDSTGAPGTAHCASTQSQARASSSAESTQGPGRPSPALAASPVNAFRGARAPALAGPAVPAGNRPCLERTRAARGLSRNASSRACPAHALTSARGAGSGALPGAGRLRTPLAACKRRAALGPAGPGRGRGLGGRGPAEAWAPIGL